MASVLLTSNLEVSLMFSSIFCAFKKKPKNMFISFRERGREREKRCERNISRWSPVPTHRGAEPET